MPRKAEWYREVIRPCSQGLFLYPFSLGLKSESLRL